MHIGITGSSGMVGTTLVTHLEAGGHRVTRLLRGSAEHGRSPSWDPGAGWIEAGAFEGCDAVVHLAGASIGEGRWTAKRKRVLRESRIEATRLLVEHLGGLQHPPRVLVSASAVGYYGGRGDEVLTEDSGHGEGFLAGLVVEWEREALAAADRGIRVVTPRFGVVLAKHGGALPRMLLPMRLGAGGPLGNGRQWMPWVTLRDVVRVIEFALTHEVRGALNAVAPGIATNRDFTKALGRELHRPASLPTPAFALRLLIGQAADELLLSSARVEPRALLERGFEFCHPTLDVALPAVLNSERRVAAAAQRTG